MVIFLVNVMIGYCFIYILDKICELTYEEFLAGYRSYRLCSTKDLRSPILDMIPSMNHVTSFSPSRMLEVQSSTSLL